MKKIVIGLIMVVAIGIIACATINTTNNSNENGSTTQLITKWKEQAPQLFDNIIYLCSGTKLYYLPLDSQGNTQWNMMDSGCSQVTGDEQYLFTTYGGNLFKYNL